MSIFDGFEGYRDPTEEEALSLLRSSPVVLDANVLLDLYSYDEPSRTVALDYLTLIRDRIFIPHQAMREFWRNRHSVIAEIQEPKRPLESVRQELLGIINGLRPDRERPDDLVAMRDEIEDRLSVLSDQIDKARGEPLDKATALRDTSLDPVIISLQSILEGRVGEALEAEDELALVDEGLRRFAAKIPPGFADASDKKDQIPERGTGDFLVWEQSLRYVEAQGEVAGFILVTNDKKEDWRINLSRPRKQELGVRPELVAEARARTGSPFILLSQSDFYRLLAKLDPATADDAASLVDAAARAATSSSDVPGTPPDWSFEAYVRLVGDLDFAGYSKQADVIVLAAQGGGFIARSDVYAAADFSDERSLNRFSYPAQRFAVALVEEGVLSREAGLPLVAVYDRPGKALGYQVPDEFVLHEARRTATKDHT